MTFVVTHVRQALQQTVAIGAARDAAKRVAEESLEQVISVEEYEVGHYIFSDELSKK